MYKDPTTVITEQTDALVNSFAAYQKIATQIFSVHTEFVTNSIKVSSDLAKTVLKTFTK